MEILGFDLSAIDLAARWRAAVAYAGPRIPPSLGILAIALVAYFPVRWIIWRLEVRLAQRTATKLDDRTAQLARRILQISAVAWAGWRLCGLWGLPAVAAAVDAIWIVALAFPVSRFAGDLLAVLETRLVEKTDATLDDTALPLVNKVVRFLIIILGAVFALDRLGLNIAPLLAGAGVMGLALSLAAKDTLSNLIAGVLLIMDRPFQVGDRIELWSSPAETGSWGDVIEIGLRATKIRNPDNLVIVVPNNEIMRRDIVNYTMSGSRIRLRIPISVEYDTNLSKAKEAILGVAGETAGVVEDPAPVVIVRAFGASDVQLQLRVWIEDARRRRAIADEITARVLERFAAQGISMPYPKRDIYVHQVGPAGAGPADAPIRGTARPGGEPDG